MTEEQKQIEKDRDFRISRIFSRQSLLGEWIKTAKRGFVWDVWFQTTIAIFCVFFLLGMILFWKKADETGLIWENLKSSFSFLKDLKSWEVFIFIFLNNAGKSFLLLLGSIIFFFLPVIFLAFNGFILGVVVARAVVLEQTWALFALLPHGPLELLTFFAVGRYGFKLGMAFLRFVFSRQPLFPQIKETFSFFARVALPLYLLAAFLETFVLLRILDLIRGISFF